MTPTNATARASVDPLADSSAEQSCSRMLEAARRGIRLSAPLTSADYQLAITPLKGRL